MRGPEKLIQLGIWVFWPEEAWGEPPQPSSTSPCTSTTCRGSWLLSVCGCCGSSQAGEPPSGTDVAEREDTRKE